MVDLGFGPEGTPIARRTHNAKGALTMSTADARCQEPANALHADDADPLPRSRRDRPSTADAVLAALGGTTASTAADVASAAGLGRSTVAKALAALAERGQVQRHPGGRDQGRRLPDRWSLPAPTSDAGPQAVPAAEVDPPHDDKDVEVEHSPAAHDGRSDVASGDADPVDASAAPDTAQDDLKPAAGPQPGTPRLGRGQLRDQIREHLSAHPDTELTPFEIGKALGRSAGAVGNALAKLTDTGEATQTSDKPRKYTLAQQARSG